MLYVSICWIACPNLLVKSRIDSSSLLRMVSSELMFPFCWTEHKYWETKAAHNSPNEFMDPLGSLCNHARAFQAGRKYLAQKTIIPCAEDHRLVKVHHMVVRVRGAIIHGERWYGKAMGWLITQDMLL